jgi:hypothetical protein
VRRGLDWLFDWLIWISGGPGYDLVTGLGSVEAYNLATGWTNVQPGVGVTMSLSANPTALSASATSTATQMAVSVTVTAVTGSNPPAGMVVFTVDGTKVGSGALTPGTGVASMVTANRNCDLHAGQYHSRLGDSLGIDGHSHGQGQQSRARQQHHHSELRGLGQFLQFQRLDRRRGHHRYHHDTRGESGNHSLLGQHSIDGYGKAGQRHHTAGGHGHFSP